MSTTDLQCFHYAMHALFRLKYLPIIVNTHATNNKWLSCILNGDVELVLRFLELVFTINSLFHASKLSNGSNVSNASNASNANTSCVSFFLLPATVIFFSFLNFCNWIFNCIVSCSMCWFCAARTRCFRLAASRLRFAACRFLSLMVAARFQFKFGSHPGTCSKNQNSGKAGANVVVKL